MSQAVTTASDVQLTDEQKSKLLTQLANTSSVHGIDLSTPELDKNRPPKAIQGEDGNYYLNNEYVDANGQWQTNPDFSTPVYFFHQPMEVGNAYGNYAEYSDDLTSATKRGNWMTEEQIKAYWDGTFDTGSINMDVFKEQHPDMTFEQYMSFISDNTQLHGQGYTIEDNPEMFSALTDKYGIKTSFQGDTGHMWGWNGSNYEKTYHADKSMDVGRMLWSAGLGAMTGGVLGPLIGGATGAAPAGFVGPLSTSQIVGGKIATGIAAGVGSAAAQGALTGKIDPGSVLASAVIAGVNPGGYVSDNYAPWYGTDPLTGDKSWMFGGAPPSSFYGGLVSGSVNDLVSTAITEGEIDLDGALQAGLISGGINSALNTWDEWNKNSQEAIADRLQHNDPFTYPDTEAGRAAAMAEALNDPLLNTTDFGAIIGDDGLLPFIPRADLGFLRAITDPVGDAIGGLVNGFDLGDVMVLSDGTKIPMEGMTDAEYQHYTLHEGGQVYSQTTMGLLNNPIVDGAANLLSGLLPAGDGSLSENLQSQKDKFDQEFLNQPFKQEELDKYFDKNGNLTVAGQVAQNDYTQLKIKTLGSFFFENSGGLNENYSWSPNPRGQSELWGTTTGIPGLYSTGTLNSWLPDGSSGTVTPPLNPDGTSVTPILNLNPEIDPVGYAEYVASLDPSSAVLPSNDEAALRNWWLQQYYNYLNQDGSDGGDASVNLGVNTGVTPDPASTNTNINTNTGGNNTNTGGNVTNNTGGNATTGTEGDDPNNVGNNGGVSNTGGGDINAGGDATTGTEVDDPNNTGVNGGVGDGGTDVDLDTTGQYGYYTAADGSQHPYNEYGAVILPNGLTISENAVNGALGLTENWWEDEEDELAGETNQPTQPGGGTLPGNGLNFGGKDGLPPVWTELFGYTKISPYQKARLKVLDGMLSGMAGGAVGNMNALSFGANRDPYQKIGKSLIDAGMEPRG